MFKRMLSALGVGGPSVDTVLSTPLVTPGGIVAGEVRIQGGSADVTVGQVALSLQTLVEMEHEDHETHHHTEFGRVVVASNVQVTPGRVLTLPFQLQAPWETPLTAFGGTALHGASVGVRTELVIAAAPDKGDLDPLQVQPLPSQAAVLTGLAHLGFGFRSADAEVGRLHGVPQHLPFYQEIEFVPPHGRYRVNEVELTFVATPYELHVILEADKKGGFFSSGRDSFAHFAMPHEEASRTDWAATVGQWLDRL